MKISLILSGPPPLCLQRLLCFKSVSSTEDKVASALVAKKIVATNAQNKKKASPASVDNVG